MDAVNNISLPAPLLAEIKIAAQAEHRTVNEVLTDAVKRYVEESSWTKYCIMARSGQLCSALENPISTA